MNKLHKKFDISNATQFKPAALKLEETVDADSSIGRFIARNPSFSPREACDFGVTLVIPENKIGQKMSLRVDKTSYVPVTLINVSDSRKIEVRVLEDCVSYKKNDLITVESDQFREYKSNPLSVFDGTP